MANVSFLWRKPTDRGTFSGGSWVAGLPLANLQTQDVQAVARTTSAASSATRFRVDCGTAPIQPFSGFALLNHNCSTAATWRIVVTDDADDADPARRTLDTGPLLMWPPTVVWGALPWGAFPWDGVDTEAYPAGPVALHFAPAPAFGRYVWVYITDTGNPAGYVQAGRFLAGQAWSPQVNASYGASIRWIDPAAVQRTRGGRRIVEARPRWRQFQMQFEALSEAEAYGVAFEMGRQLGKAGDFLLVMDPDEEAGIRFRRTIYAALADPEPISIPNFDQHSWALTAEELI